MIAQTLDLPRGEVTGADADKKRVTTHVVTWWDPTFGQWEEEGYISEEHALAGAEELSKSAPDRTFHIVEVKATSYVFRGQ